MDSRTLTLLGFDRIKTLIASKTQTAFGFELSLQLEPMEELSMIQRQLDLLQECLDISDEPSLSGVLDLRTYLLNMNEDTILSGAILNDFKGTLEAIRNIKIFITKRKDITPQVYKIIQNISNHELIEKSINCKIDEYGEVLSNASAKLKKVRNELTKKRNDIIKKLEAIAKEQSNFLQDNNIVIRHNRYCLPLKIEAQNKLHGITHEFSPAGRTIFFEPLIIVENQNELTQLKDEENDEIQRILSDLSKEIFAIRDILLLEFSTIGKLDVLLAKKRFTIQFSCTKPKYSEDGTIRIKKGIHPLLKLTRDKVTPLDLVFPNDINVILISGPNAGGKTVVLKTVGLFALMFLSGLYIPAANGTEFPFFKNVYADIGDEQSLDTNLSSFSAHLLRVKEILKNADENTLVLLDEIGSSTAPEEGSALAIAVLESLRDKGTYCLATSHLNPLKSFVSDAPGMINASMEYTDHPTYRFSIGSPGTSSAFELSKKLGFPSELIERAKRFVNQDWLNLSERLKNLANETEKTIELNNKLDIEKDTLEHIKTEYEARLDKLKIFEQDERKKFISEIRKQLTEQRRNIENLVRHIKESSASKQSIIQAKTYIQEQLNSLDIQKNDTKQVEKENYQIGERVFSKTFQRTGLISELNKNHLTIIFGSIKLELDYDDIKKVAAVDISDNKIQEHTVYENQQIEFESVLNIRGQTKEEALISINRFLDDAINNNTYEVSIIHGKGKGVLKDLIWDILKQDFRVNQIRFGEPFEGGIGLTKVVLKKI